MKKINKKQGIGLFFMSIGILSGIVSNCMSRDYGHIILGIAILFLVGGLFLFLRNVEK